MTVNPGGDANPVGVAIPNQVQPGKAPAEQYVKHPQWKLLCALCLLGTLFQSLKPSTPFITPFLRDRHGMSGDDISNQYYPYRTYSMFVFMVPITVLAEFFVGYKPILLLGIVARVTEQYMLYYCQAITSIKLSQVLHGLASSTKTVHGALLYLIVPRHLFPLATGLLRVSNLSGQVLEGISSNVVYDNVERDLAYFSLFTTTQVTVTTGGIFMIILFIILAKERKSASHRDASRPLAPRITSFHSAISLLRKVYLDTPQVLIWSFWWWTAYSVGEMVDEMHTALIYHYGGTKNGYLSAIIGISSASGAFMAGRSKNFVQKRSSVIVIVCLILSGSMLMFAALACSMKLYEYAAYAAIVLTLLCSEGSAVAANSIISVALPKSLRGLTMFVNTFLQLGFQTLVQFIPQRLGLSISHKFMSLAAILWIVCFVIVTGTVRSNQQKQRSDYAVEVYDSETAEARKSGTISSLGH